jgi:hypothetical protein
MGVVEGANEDASDWDVARLISAGLVSVLSPCNLPLDPFSPSCKCLMMLWCDASTPYISLTKVTSLEGINFCDCSYGSRGGGFDCAGI